MTQPVNFSAAMLSLQSKLKQALSELYEKEIVVYRDKKSNLVKHYPDGTKEILSSGSNNDH